MPKITIVRPHEWANQAKNINIYIDGKKATRVGINQTVQIDLSAGKHKVVLNQRWAGGSKPLVVDLSDNEDKTLKMSSFSYGFLIAPFLYIIVSSFYHTVLSSVGFIDYLLGNALVVLLLYILLYFTLFRTRFLKLEEVEVDHSKKITKEEQARLISKIMEDDERDGLYEA